MTDVERRAERRFKRSRLPPELKGRFREFLKCYKLVERGELRPVDVARHFDLEPNQEWYIRRHYFPFVGLALVRDGHRVFTIERLKALSKELPHHGAARVVARRARTHGFSVRAVVRGEKPSEFRALANRIRIEGRLCHLYTTRTKQTGSKLFSPVNVCPSAFADAEFVFFCRMLETREEEIFIRPADEIRAMAGDRCRVTAYIPTTVFRTQWEPYLDAWYLLRQFSEPVSRIS